MSDVDFSRFLVSPMADVNNHYDNLPFHISVFDNSSNLDVHLYCAIRNVLSVILHTHQRHRCKGIMLAGITHFNKTRLLSLLSADHLSGIHP